MHYIKDGKLVFKIESTGEEYAIPVSKEALLSHLTKETSFMNTAREFLFHLAAIKKWGDEYIDFQRKYMSDQAKALAGQFLKAKGIKPGEGKAKTFFQLASPQLERGGTFLGPESEQNIEVLELNDKKVHVHIRACPLYAGWKKVGISDEDSLKLCKLHCYSSIDLGKPGSENFDEAFAKILNPKLQYRVRQSLAQGKEYCDITEEIVD